MSTLVIRGKNNSFTAGIEMTDEKRRRIRKYLISVGVPEEILKPIIWPEDAVSAYREHSYAPWKFTTKKDILREKRKSMEQNLWFKREYGVTQKRPLYVWVFWCPGISGVFEGLWTYIVGLGRDYHGGGYKGQVDGHLLDDIMRLFPVCNLFPVSHDQWQEEFIKKYRRGTHCGKPQGKAPIWAEVKGDSIVRILGRAQWKAEQGK